MITPTYVLRHWLAENNIHILGLTVTLHFQNARDGARFDAALRRELGSLKEEARRQVLLSEFEMNGIKVKVESPIHEKA
jgi:hypothetical protein